MNSAEIRTRWLNFFESGNSQGLKHTVVPSASLIADDPNLLLVNAGMVPFKPFFLGEIKAPYARATSVQKCVRTLDIDEVGKTTRHASFFQMCGNFSFGDYFKEGAIALAWELLTKPVANGGYGFPEEKLWVTVFQTDDEAADIWHKKIGIPKERIQRRGMEDNFWSMGVPGPCGPCSEIYYDRGPEYGRDGGPIANEDRYLEVWNLVFMQNMRGSGSGKDDFPILGELPAKSIDTGLGLERMAALLQGVENIYEIDTTMQILNVASELTGVKYGANEKSDVALRVIADHARTSMMLIGDGVLPGNEGRGYVLRRMMRRTIRNMRILGAGDPTSRELVAAAIGAMGTQYPELVENKERITAVTVNEEESFLTTLKSGTQIFDVAAGSVKKSKSTKLDGDTVFKLHDTYGFPFDLTLEMASEAGLSVDEEGFRKLMKEQKDRAKADARTKKTGHTDVSEYRKILDASGATKFTGYTETSSESKIAAIMVDGKSVQEADINTDVELILDRTPFYAEGGGQLPDGGLITLSNGAVVEIDDVQTPVPGLYIHRGQVISGSVDKKSVAIATIDIERRLAISRAHTATHMVHKAFREILGETATQAGSENSPGRFRFDFPATGAVPASVLEEVEGRVNNLLLDNLKVTAKVMTQPEAKAMGAMALFGEKYGDQVRVVSVGDWAHELCGGTHVKSSGELGVVKLLSEASIGAGVRRVEALVGRDAYGFLAREHLLLNSLTEIIKGARIEELPARISDLIDRLKSVEKELATFKTAQILATASELLKSTSKVSGFEVLSAELEPNISGDDLRTISLDLRNRLSDGIVILASKGSDRSTLVVAASPKAIKSGIKAGALVKLGSEILGGGGGGKDDFAQGGGANHSEIANALSAISKSIGQIAGK
ncbi:MAG: alanine--tRNA ligase [Actinobacteria bacterium]|uniref:Alanine--tRNA ligase n=1 Tax=freshwater metagenome TaxID=449393 RepID=A0A6J6Z3E7_9ZZZZ|nr:alanine--tRNA ligase [Actinomycetota bacterium]MSW21998.1 alanine--tRNA ligase [Actinomycetota bacterium]MSX03481.1 alanine--tRNA ligase [Actinomycetota bacterium]MSX83571.1 alanine--tRNA ligase [Actinomycetota bacterium]MSY96671.1 alanine--tRNA ligase [Actinomycetota bacterium]